MPKDTLERYCEVVAALKVRTSNKKGRHLSTSEAIRLLEEEGINTPDGALQAPKGLLKKATVNRYLKQWGYDYETLRRQPPAVRFQAEQSNECWHFDLSPSDLKHVKSPATIEPGRGHPLLMLYSVVDDRSGVAYQEYHGVYGEDVGAALRFLFAAMLKLGTFITALFYDLSTEKDFKPPTQPETRERKLLELMQKRRTPVALFVDDAHDLHHRTLIGLKRLIELVRLYGSGGSLSIVLAGHPKLKNDLRRPSLEEIGGRATVFSLEGIRTHQREYIEWVLAQASGGSVELTELLSEEAISLLVSRLATPLQIEQYLTLAFEEAYSIGTKPVTAEVIETVLAVGLDDLEPHLTRNGYNAKVLAELLNVRPVYVRSFLHGQLPPGRTQDLREKMLKVGIPI